MRRLFSILILLALLLGAWAFASWYAWSKADAVVPDEVTSFRVSPGDTFLEAYRDLARADIIEPSWRWLVLISWRRPRCLQAGIHDITPEQTPAALIDRLCEPGHSEAARVTIREGATRWHIADYLGSLGLVSRGRFIDLTGLPIELEATGFEAATAEGFLFPDTYDFSPNASEAQIVRTMLSRFEQVWVSLLREHSGALGEVTSAHELRPIDIVTVASIVEREAIVADERPRIAQVIYNRLALDMPLQMDPTCVYGPDRYEAKPSPDLCRGSANRWSTYAHNGLPPGPISNPGRASLEAALRPSGEEKILYFVARNDGSHRHAFSETYDEHRRHVRRNLGGGR